MLSRIARRKNALFHLRKAYAQRTLTFPTSLRLHSHSTWQSPVVPTPVTSAQERPRRPSFQSSRNLATATDQSAIGQASIDNHPFSSPSDYDKIKQWADTMLQMPTDEFDPSSLIILDDYLQTRPKTVRKIQGIGGDQREMIANMDVSLKVGRFDRAAALIARVRHYFPLGSPEYLALHNRYMNAMVSHMIVTRQQQMILQLQRWFEIEMPNEGVRPDATTYSIMIRMALRMLYGSKRDRTVRRYWQLAKKAGIDEEEIAGVEILSDLEFGELFEICPSEFPNFHNAEAEHPAATVDNVAEVLATEQKGLGLTSLKESLSSFSNKSLSADNDADRAIELEERQRQLEADTIKTALSRWRKEFEDRQKTGLDVSARGKRLGTLMHQWQSNLASRIKEELKMIDKAEMTKVPANKEEKERQDYGVYMRCLDPDQLAALTILSVISVFTGTGIHAGVKLSSIASNIGQEVNAEVIAETILKKHATQSPRRKQAVKQLLSRRKQREGAMRWKTLVHGLQAEDDTITWPSAVTVRVGAALFSMLHEVAKVPVPSEDTQTFGKQVTMHPAFQHSYQITWGRRQGLIHMNNDVVSMLTREPTADLLGRQLPMLCKPKPWTGQKEGGYFLYENNIVRSTPGETLQPAYVRAALENNGMAEIRAALDVLGSTGWAINTEVFDVMLEAWNSGEAVGKLAPIEPDLPIPPKPDPSAGYEAEKKWDAQMRILENKRSGYHSVRCFQNFQLEIARSYRNETFYLPHNLDFRGRAYPLPPYLNQMGADNSRALLLFSEAKPLRASGLRWLKIQVANLAGYDKASLSEREQFTMDHMEDVLDSANNGLHGKKWWLKAEDPWQCLASCIELRNALRYPDPTEYPSRLPIHQDGSCNGLQHYAALGGDIVGAQQVNLEPSDRPSDVYTGVSEFVKAEVAREAAEGFPIAQLLHGKITRKVVKQTVMTNVYGVTFMGAMKQVRRQLIDHYPEMSTQEHKDGSLYIARKIFNALGSMFNGAHEIQYWLGDCAARATVSLTPEQIEELMREAMGPTGNNEKRTSLDPTKKFRSTVVWTTPLGLPVVQPYRTRKTRRIKNSLQDINIIDDFSDDVVHKRKQLQAFPPNYIHSLDATHMILSANACNKAGLTFSAVHDSFWTHASDVDDMNILLRDAFVRLHSDDVVGRLAAEFDVRYGKNLYLARIDVNKRVGSAVRRHRLNAPKRQSQLTELFEEYRRQTLLRSQDPEQQAQGRAMVTPASIFEAMGGSDKDLIMSSSLGQSAVGHVPENIDTTGLDSPTPPSLMDPEDLNLSTAEDRIELMSNPHVNVDADAEAADQEAPKPKKQRNVYTWMWLPLKFAPVPAKGAWDLSRIRDSKYFFS
ncbi:mitochondrial DNA-directed RNA polymerase [Penicillium riverlandense]|uniref:mitochondrial DNA-directed RNA polymerase n=1 Tax=Penicillium riverlandense TaxID=1903569 RepID=UPI0025487A87|nr:mitochondrial DNA-directed RNA polymerase [Penicillium riverlandense]KAJ5811691.1 mitochondrial DNA-directed RNA polymerase [Penicillium riverlandense]